MKQQKTTDDVACGQEFLAFQGSVACGRTGEHLGYRNVDNIKRFHLLSLLSDSHVLSLSQKCLQKQSPQKKIIQNTLIIMYNVS